MKVQLFIDGENFIHKVKEIFVAKGITNSQLNVEKIDLKGLIATAFPDYTFDKLRYYSAKLHPHPESPEKSKELILKQRILKSNLEKQGFEFILAGNVRAQKIKADGKSKTIFSEKGVDVRIAVDLVSLSCDKYIDTAVLCSSDSDLQPAVQELRKRGIEVVYLGFAINPNKGLTFTTNKTVLFRDNEIVHSVPLKKK